MVLIFEIIIGLLVLMSLVVAHELGHAVIAKRNGVVVEEFGVGFPPTFWSKKLKNGILLSLNWLPLGGFVKMQGEYDAANKKGDYGSATFWKKTKILLAGVAVNWLVAVVLLTGLALVGLPKVLPDQVTIPGDTTIITKPVEISVIMKNYPADKAGLKTGDKVVRLAGQLIPTISRLTELTKKYKGQNVMIVYDRNGTEYSQQVDLRNGNDGNYLGVGLDQSELIKATWSAPIVGVASTAQFTWLTISGIGDLFSNLANGVIMQFSFNANVRQQASSDLKSVSNNVSGPIGILGMIFPAAVKAGPTQLVFLTAIISISLAVMNVLPIPALDGGRWFVAAIYKISKKKLTKEREEKIQTIGFLVLMGLVVLVTFADVSKLF